MSTVRDETGRDTQVLGKLLSEMMAGQVCKEQNHNYRLDVCEACRELQNSRVAAHRSVATSLTAVDVADAGRPQNEV